MAVSSTTDSLPKFSRLEGDHGYYDDYYGQQGGYGGYGGYGQGGWRSLELQSGACGAVKATIKEAMAPMAVSGIRVARARACTSPACPWPPSRFLLWPLRRLLFRDQRAYKHVVLVQADLWKHSRHLRRKNPQLLCSNCPTSRGSIECCRCWGPCTVCRRAKSPQAATR